MLKSFKEKYHSKNGRVWYGFEWSTAGGGEYHFIIAAYVNGAQRGGGGGGGWISLYYCCLCEWSTAGGGEYHFIIAAYVNGAQRAGVNITLLLLLMWMEHSGRRWISLYYCCLCEWSTAGGGEYHFIIAAYVIHISCEVEFWNNWWKFFPLIW